MFNGINVAACTLSTRLRGLVAVGVSVVAAGAALLSAGCGSGVSTASQTLIKSVNAYVPASGADGSLVFFANTTYLTGLNLAFGTVGNSGGFVSIPSGVYSLTCSTLNTNPNKVVLSLPNQTFAGNNTAYTVIAAGQAGQTGTLQPQTLVLKDYVANQITLPSSTVAVRIVNLSLNPNPVGLYDTTSNNPTTAVASTTGSVPYYVGSVPTGYVAIPTASLINMAIVDSTAPKAALALSSGSNLNTNTLIAGDAYTLYIYGVPSSGSTPLGATWVQDYPAP